MEATTETITDAELVRRAAARDACAFDGLLRRYQDRAVAYARTLLPDAASAEDAAQEAFVQAWRDLPALREPAAFPAWLRRIVWKYCDRARRKAPAGGWLSLDAAGHITGGVEPARAAEASADAARVRAALSSLPPRPREAAVLYYLGGRDLAEIAAFLGVPVTTVKNRLHAARTRLRKELYDMSDMAEETLHHEKPSRDGAFAENVLARIMAEYERQRRADPHTADRALLAEARTTLTAALAAPDPLAWETVRAGFDLCHRENDPRALAALLMRCVAQPALDDSRAAWARVHLANACACAGDAVGTVYAYEEMDRWLGGRAPRLLTRWPYDPAGPDAPASDVYDGPAEVRLLALGQSAEFARSWGTVGRLPDYFARVDAALGHAPPTAVGRELRFSCLRMSTAAAEHAGDWDASRRALDAMFRLAEDPAAPPEERAAILAKALGHDLNLRRLTHDEAGLSRTVAALIAHVAAYPDAPWARGQRHDLAHFLLLLDRPAEALPLLDTNLATGGHANAYGYLAQAVAVWRTHQDRPRTLTLLREAAARDDRDLTALVRDHAAFAAFRDDAAFLEALRKPGA